MKEKQNFLFSIEDLYVDLKKKYRWIFNEEEEEKENKNEGRGDDKVSPQTESKT